MYQCIFQRASVSSYVSMSNYQSNNLSKAQLPAIFIVSFFAVTHFPTYQKQNEWAYIITYQDFLSIVNNRRYLNLGINTVPREVYLHIKARGY